MKFKIRSFVLMLTVVIMMFGTTITAFAADSGNNADIQKALDDGNGTVSGYSNYFTTGLTVTEAMNYAADYEYYSYKTSSGGTAYAVIKKEDRDKVVQGLSSSTTMTNTSIDILHQQDFSADTQGAMGLLSGLFPAVRTLLGIITVLVTAGMTIFSAFDLCYIAFPVFRNKCEDVKQKGGMGTTQNKQTGETKLRFISDDAVYAVNAANTVESGKNPFVVYFGKRALSYVILAVLIFIMFTGKITIFADLALKVVSGVLKLLQGI